MANSNHNPKHVFKSKEMKTASDHCSAMFSSLKTLIPPKESIKSSQKLNKFVKHENIKETLLKPRKKKQTARNDLFMHLLCDNMTELLSSSELPLKTYKLEKMWVCATWRNKRQKSTTRHYLDSCLAEFMCQPAAISLLSCLATLFSSRGLPVQIKTWKDDPKFDEEEELEKELAEVNIAYAATCENVERLQAEYNQLKKEADGKITHEKNKLKKITNLENEYAILSKSKISSKDEQLMEIQKMRYKVLRNMTQVRFKFEESDNNRLEGLAFNTANNKIKCFTINDLEELKPDQITDHIIAAMETVSQKNYADIPLE